MRVVLFSEPMFCSAAAAVFNTVSSGANCQLKQPFIFVATKKKLLHKSVADDNTREVNLRHDTVQFQSVQPTLRIFDHIVFRLDVRSQGDMRHERWSFLIWKQCGEVRLDQCFETLVDIGGGRWEKPQRPP